ncbi:MAG: PilZ domain-containing protein [Candidatus Sericytochromatia bacterium]|nr:PilZ domain-containing protein [Candidatus Tanganyikabacteria bacterium]
MDINADLEVGDVLGRDLVHPETAQTMLPAGTILNAQHIWKIKGLGLEADALRCVRIGLQDQAEASRLAFDYDVFLKAKAAVRLLERTAQGERGADGRFRPDPQVLDKAVTGLVSELLARIERVPEGSYLDLRLYDAYLYGHPVNMATLAMSMGRAMGASRDMLVDVGRSAFYADCGKFRLARELLFKAEPLSAAELADVRRHVALGVNLVGQWEVANSTVAEAVASHHERFDGQGYPRRLAGTAVPVAAQLISVADVYDAMVSDLPYRKRMDSAVAYRSVVTQRGKAWADGIVAAFEQVVAPYPVNTLVRLNTGEAALVVAASGNQFKPVVRVGDKEIDLAAEPTRRIAGSLTRRYFYRELMGMEIEAGLGGAAGTVFPAMLQDMSLNGLSLTAAGISPEPGDPIALAMPVPGVEGAMLIEGRVVWVRHEPYKVVRVGVAFEDISESTKQRLIDAMWGRA